VCRSALAARIGRIVDYSHRVNTLVAAAAFVGYGLALYAWWLGQSVGAIVIATLGYLLFRSLRRISFSFTWQAFAEREGYAEAMCHIDAELLMLQRERIVEQVLAAVDGEREQP